MTGDSNDLKKLVKQVMNKSVAKRLISKQEAVVMLGRLDMCKCTERIENVSISNTTQLRTAGSDDANKSTINKYKNRGAALEGLSLYEFFHHIENKGDKSKRDAKIPHFIGINGRPRYPVTADYAKHCLLVHKPWRGEYPTSYDWLAEFHIFINDPKCPVSARMTYERVHCRFLAKMNDYDPTADFYDNTSNPIDADDKTLMELVGLHKSTEHDFDDRLLSQLERGVDHEWDKDAQVRILFISDQCTF